MRFNVGFFCVTEKSRALNLRLATGHAALENQKAPIEIKSMVTIKGRKMRNTESPADLRAVSSLRSASEPKAMMEATRMASGRARFTSRAEA